MTTAKISNPVVHLSSIVKCPLVDEHGDRLGRVEDLVVRLGPAHPPVVGGVVRIGGRDLFVPIRKFTGFGEKRLGFKGKRVDLRRFERRPGEVLLARDLRSRHLIHVVGGRLIRANEIELAAVDGTWEVIGVDPTARPILRRVLPRQVSYRSTGAVVDWGNIEPFVSHVPTARLRIPFRKLARLHPAQIADLVEAASHEEGEEIIQAVGADRELEADVFEELDTEHQVEFLESRSDTEAARLLATMAPDDAADLIMEVDQDRRLHLLEELPEPSRKKVRLLLTYNPETAGGLMSPDVLCLPESATIAAALDAIRQSRSAPETLSVVFARDRDGAISGSATVVALVRADPTGTLRSVAAPLAAHVHPDWDVGATLRTMSDFNLTVAPVLDPEHRDLVGVVTVDDVLELLLPSGWRRDFGATSPEN